MCFEQMSTRDPKVLCSTRIKSSRNSSRLDMHREVKNCDLSPAHSKTLVTVTEPLVSGSAATQTRWDRLFERLQLHQTSISCTSSQNVVIPSNGSSYPFKKNYCHPFERLAGAICSKAAIANFSNSSSQSVKKNTRRYSSKTKSSAVRASASRSK